MKKIKQERKQQLFELLVEKNLVPGLFDKYLDTYMSHKEIVEALLVHGVNPDYYAPYYEVPILALAESRNEVDAFLLLLDYGANPNVKSSTDGTKANIIHSMTLAQENKYNRKMFKALLKAKVDFNILNPTTGQSILIDLVSYCPLATEKIKTILEHGADPHLKNRNGDSIYDLMDRNEINIIDSVKALLNAYRK